MKLIQGLLIFLLGYIFIYIITNFKNTLKKIFFIGDFIDEDEETRTNDMYLIVIFYTLFFMINF